MALAKAKKIQQQLKQEKTERIKQAKKIEVRTQFRDPHHMMAAMQRNARALAFSAVEGSKIWTGTSALVLGGGSAGALTADGGGGGGGLPLFMVKSRALTQA